MEARNVTFGQLLSAAEQSGVELKYPQVKAARKSTTGQAISFTLGLKPEKKWQRLGYMGRKVNAVCWHGHREFMRAAYRQAPDMILKSAKATYRGQDHFETSHNATGYGNIGSMMQPLQYRDACTCDHN